MPEEKQPTMTLTQPQIDSPPTETPQPTDDDTLGPGPVPTEEYPPEIPSRDPSDGTISDNERYYRQLAETLNAALNISPHEEKNDSHLHRRRSHHLR